MANNISGMKALFLRTFYDQDTGITVEEGTVLCIIDFGPVMIQCLAPCKEEERPDWVPSDAEKGKCSISVPRDVVKIEK